MDKLVILLVTISNIILINGQCKWTGIGGTTTSLDLSCLAGRTINSPDDNSYTYKYSICSNEQSCTGANSGGDTGSGYMVAQTSTNPDNDFYTFRC